MRTFKLFWLALLASCHGLAVQKVEKVPKPSLLVLTALDPPSLQVEWRPVRGADEKDPVLGYKVKVWELQPIELMKYADIDGLSTWVKELISPKINESETPPEEDAMEMVVTDPYASKAIIPEIKLNVIYEIRVRAFTKSLDGPLSDYMRIQLLEPGKKNQAADTNEYNFV